MSGGGGGGGGGGGSDADLVVLRVNDVHPPPCSVYAVAWGGERGELIATGSNDGGVGVLRLAARWSGADTDADTGEEEEEHQRRQHDYSSSREATAAGKAAAPLLELEAAGPAAVTRGAHEGAVRGVAFASPYTLVSAGADAAPRLWDLGRGGGRPLVTRTLQPHETPVVGVVAGASGAS